MVPDRPHPSNGIFAVIARCFDGGSACIPSLQNMRNCPPFNPALPKQLSYHWKNWKIHRDRKMSINREFTDFRKSANFPYLYIMEYKMSPSVKSFLQTFYTVFNIFICRMFI